MCCLYSIGPRQAVMLEISGHGSTKGMCSWNWLARSLQYIGEAGKQTSFSIKSKSVNMDVNQPNLSVTVKVWEQFIVLILIVHRLLSRILRVKWLRSITKFWLQMMDTQFLILLFWLEHTVSNHFVSHILEPWLHAAIDVFVGGHLAHTMAVPVVEGGPVASNTEAAWSSLNGSAVGNRSQMIVIPKSFIKSMFWIELFMSNNIVQTLYH